MVFAEYLKNICYIFTKFGTQKYQGKTKTKFGLGALDLIFEVAEVILKLRHVKDGFRSISEELFDVFLTIFGTQKHQSMRKTKIELSDLDLIFEVIEVI